MPCIHNMFHISNLNLGSIVIYHQIYKTQENFYDENLMEIKKILRSPALREFTKNHQHYQTTSCKVTIHIY